MGVLLTFDPHPLKNNDVAGWMPGEGRGMAGVKTESKVLATTETLFGWTENKERGTK